MDFGAITVSGLNAYLKTKFMTDDILNGIYIKGEISNISRYNMSGHIYFTLKDVGSQIKAVMFRPSASRLKFIPESGMRVLIYGSVRIYDRDGIYQIYAEEMQPDGIGALAAQFEQLKEKLRKEGIFNAEHKKPIPRFPSEIAVITSGAGAVFHDIINVLRRRYPIAAITLLSVQVQGERAAGEIVNAIKTADNGLFDVIIVARGGGSSEDMQCFNSEAVAYAVYDCKTPVISAIGHETDFTIIDFAADMRAPTPSAAAEIVAEDIGTVKITIDKIRHMMYNNTITGVNDKFFALASVVRRLSLSRPEKGLLVLKQRLKGIKERINYSMEDKYKYRRQRYTGVVSKLEALNPLSVLARGYSITYSKDNIVKSGREIAVGDELITMVSQGKIISKVTNVE